MNARLVALAHLLIMSIRMRSDNELIREVLRLCREMIILADNGQEAAREDGCRLLFGVLQDCAYKIRHEAERERDAHRRQGRWID